MTDYAAYLRSPQWRATRERTLRLRGRRCEACGSRHRLDVHHRTYVRLGRETEDDLRVLCRHCHETAHDAAKARRQPVATTTDELTDYAGHDLAADDPTISDILGVVLWQSRTFGTPVDGAE